MEWVRGEEIGRGSFATVSLAIPRRSSTEIPPLMAVKSSDAIGSALLKNEREVLDQLGTCPQIIRCYGHDYSVEKGNKFYNLLLEYASGGSLADIVKSNGGRLPESDVPRYTRTILEGLRFVHARGFVHCDIKLQNILLFDNGNAKIADFGLAMKTRENREKTEGKFEWKGTPLYMSPESVNADEYEPPCDVWALGCAVVEMVTGNPAWNFQAGTNVFSLMLRIGVGDELPEVPSELSEEGRDFLGKCFMKDPRKRWTAEMLLKHPFVGHDVDSLKNMDELTVSPRGPLDFDQWNSVQSPAFSPDSDKWFERKLKSYFGSSNSSYFSSPADRVWQLVTDVEFDWPVSDRWVTVRGL